MMTLVQQRADLQTCIYIIDWSTVLLIQSPVMLLLSAHLARLHDWSCPPICLSHMGLIENANPGLWAPAHPGNPLIFQTCKPGFC